MLQCSHQADFISGAAVRQPREFLDADAMLGGYRAADRYERFRDAFIACVVMAAFLIGLHKKVQIAIGQMTERATVTVGPAFRDVLLDHGNVVEHFADGQSDVVEIDGLWLE